MLVSELPTGLPSALYELKTPVCPLHSPIKETQLLKPKRSVPFPVFHISKPDM